MDTTKNVRRPRVARHTPRLTDGMEHPVVVRHTLPRTPAA